MAIDLGDYEAGKHLDGDYDDELAKLQKRLSSHPDRAHHPSAPRRDPVRGLGCSGEGRVIKRLTGEWDPRYFEVSGRSPRRPRRRRRITLWRFWRRLPAQHSIAVFDRSWYGRVLVERVEGFAGEAE